MQKYLPWGKKYFFELFTSGKLQIFFGENIKMMLYDILFCLNGVVKLNEEYLLNPNPKGGLGEKENLSVINSYSTNAI